LQGFFQDNNCYAMMKQAIEKGHLHDMDTMIGKLRELLGDCTFAEAYERTGVCGWFVMHVCVLVVLRMYAHQMPRTKVVNLYKVMHSHTFLCA
jgi:hypothetical protein